MPVSSPPPTILIVEDDALLRDVAAETLRQEGYRTVEAADATEALVALDSHADIRLLVTDINMPGISGLDLVGMAGRRRPELKIVVTSGRHALGSDMLPDAVVFLAKPYSASRFIGVVRSMLAEQE